MRSVHLPKWFSLGAVLMVLLAASPLYAAPPAPLTTAERQAQALARIVADGGEDVRVSIQRGTGVAGFVRLPGGGFAVSDAGDPVEARADAFLRNYGALFGIRDFDAELARTSVETDATGNQHVSYREVHRGLGVFGGDLRVHFDATGNVTSAGGVFVPDVEVDVQGAISAQQAELAAIEAVLATGKSIAGGAPTVLASEMLVYRTGLVQGVAGTVHLAYRVEVGNRADVREVLFIDTLTGAILDRFSGIHEDLQRELYEMHLAPANLVWEEGDAFPTGNLDWNSEISGAGETYNLFGSLTNGSWLSYDSAGAMMKTVNNDPGISCPNANWNGVSTNYCTGVSGDDTVAHEWGHAYTEYTHNLIYAWQPGALNESYSDIWGEVVDLLNNRGLDTPAGLRSSAGLYCSTADTTALPPRQDTAIRWVSGEDDPAFGGPIRDMWRPECHGDPGFVTSSRYTCSTSDGGGVHTNSGVPNHGFALLVDGGAFNGQTVSGIGLNKASRIYWQAQRYYQTTTTDFAGHADALEAACSDLVGATLYELKTTGPATWGATSPAITQADCAEVSDMILAVQFRTPPNCSFAAMFDPNAPALCTVAGESPQHHLFQDFESGLTGWTTQQTPVNAATWNDRPWTTVTSAPAGHPGFTAFGPDPLVGDCSNDLDNGVTSLLSPVISIPAGATAPVRMAWDHLVSMELNYDGGNLKASVNGGAFTLVPASAFTFNDYSGTLATSNNDNPMAGQAAWTGGDAGAVSSKWGQSQIDLSKISVDGGDTVQFRWDLGSDGCNGWDGWYVDSVRVYSCAACATPGAPADLTVEQVDAATARLDWTAHPSASKYEVWTAQNGMYFDPLGMDCANPAPYACTVVTDAAHAAADLGDPAVTHSYVVRSANACGQTSGASNRVAEFEFGLAR